MSKLGIIRRNPKKSLAGALVGGGAAYKAFSGNDVADETEMPSFAPTAGGQYENVNIPEMPSLVEQLKDIYTVPPEVSLTKEEKETQTEANKTLKDLAIQYEKTKDAETKAQLAEIIGQAVAKYGAARSGMKEGVAVPELRLDKTDWRARRRDDQADIDRDRKRQADIKKEIDANVEKRRQERTRAVERRDDALARGQAADVGIKHQTALHEAKLADRQNQRVTKGQAKATEARAKMNQDVNAAEELVRQAQEASGTERVKLLDRARMSLINAGLPPEAVEKTFTKDSKAWFSDRITKKDRSPDEIDFSAIRKELTSSPSPAKLSKEDEAALNYIRENPDAPASNQLRDVLKKKGILP